LCPEAAVHGPSFGAEGRQWLGPGQRYARYARGSGDVVAGRLRGIDPRTTALRPRAKGEPRARPV